MPAPVSAQPPTPPALVQAAPSQAGPTLPHPKGVARQMPAAPQVSTLVRSTLREMGAVVVVEGEMPAPVGLLPQTLNLFGGNLRLFASSIAQPSWVGPVAVPVWNDPSVVRAGGNVVAHVYSLGGFGM